MALLSIFFTVATVCQVWAENETLLYFGCGCFWHIQHELVGAERRILDRSDEQLTALVGYAGGTGPNGGGHACYPPKSSDGELGHAEVVQVSVPPSKAADFAKAYWSLFVGINRVDTQDVGRDYRAVLGLPGGADSEMAKTFRDAQGSQKFEMKGGKGGDDDTLGKALVWVYDTDSFLFYQGEVYHQFHNDFQGPAYKTEYNALRDEFLADCRLQPTGCPGDESARGQSPANCSQLGTAATAAPPALLLFGLLASVAF